MSAELAASLLDLMDEVVIAQQVRERLKSDAVVSGTVEEFFEGTGVEVAAARSRRIRHP
ncbi:MAG: hypothetical protein ACR2MA_06785 [Egibacteraceae bacterium]